MGIHYKKTTCMAVGTKQKLSHTEKLNIKIENNEIEPVSSQKLLGLHIDENLNWTMHIDYMCVTICSRISQLKQLSHYIQNIFYQEYILPLIDYGSTTWGHQTIQVYRLNKLPKRADGIILRANLMTPSS